MEALIISLSAQKSNSLPLGKQIGISLMVKVHWQFELIVTATLPYDINLDTPATSCSIFKVQSFGRSFEDSILFNNCMQSPTWTLQNALEIDMVNGSSSGTTTSTASAGTTACIES